MVSCCWRNGTASSSWTSKMHRLVCVCSWQWFGLGLNLFSLLSCFSMPSVSWDWNSFSAHIFVSHRPAAALIWCQAVAYASWVTGLQQDQHRCSLLWHNDAGSCGTDSWRIQSDTLWKALSMLVDHGKFEKDRYRLVQVWKRYFWSFCTLSASVGRPWKGRMCVGTLLIKARNIHASHWDIVMMVS